MSGRSPEFDHTLAVVRQRLAAARRLILIAHEHPDGDAIGSVLALEYVLTALGHSVRVVCKDPVPGPFRFLPGADRFEQRLGLRAGDLVVTLDCGDLRRTGFPAELRAIGGPKGSVMNIDHHQRNDLHKVASINLVDYEASSAAEIVYELIRTFQYRLDKRTATAILTGIYNDTGGFRHSNTTPHVLAIASRLLLAGARLRDITQNVANFRSVSSLKLWGVALERIRCHHALGIVASVVTQRDLATCQALQEDIAGAVNLINHVPEARVAILCLETADGQIKASLRTEHNDIDVSRLAGLFGGGGLKKAAGFSIRGTIDVAADGTWRVLGTPDVFQFSQPATWSRPVEATVSR